jgi:tetratricopeptide (TPR) repeat protein
MNKNQSATARNTESASTGGASSITAKMLDQAVQCYKAGNYTEAERLSRQVLMIDAQNSESLHLLGAVALRTGDYETAVELLEQAIKIQGNNASCYNSLGNAHLARGKRDEAGAAYERATTLDPDYAEAHLNLGNILMFQGKMMKAKARYERALVHKPDYASAHMNLGNVYKNLDRVEEAIACYESALAINPHYAEAHNNLALSLLTKGKIDEAQARFERALTLRPNFPEACTYLCLTHFTKTPITEWEGLCLRFLQIKPLPRQYEHELYVRLAIHYWTIGNYASLGEALKLSTAISDVENFPDRNYRNMKAYEKFLKGMLNYCASCPPARSESAAREMVLLGDSHSLSYANVTLDVEGLPHKIASHLIMGCKAFHFSGSEMNQYKWGLYATLDRLPPGTKCIMSAGEIDCRYDEGIIGNFKSHGGKLENIATSFVQSYVKNVVTAMRERKLDVSFLNVPAPNVEGLRKGYTDFTPEEEDRLVMVIRLFNDELARVVSEYGCRVIDIYGLTAGPDGRADGSYHNDEHHLKPDALGLAFAGSQP